MTEAPSTTRSTDPETARVEAAIDALLAAHDPTTTDNVEFRGARYDAGLAWVHFPERLRRPRAAARPEPARREAAPRRRRAADESDDVLHGPRRADDRHPWQRRSAANASCARCSPARSVWCQLFSEPGAGSDFAGLATKAVRDGDEWIVNGQKVWNTLAHIADFGMLVTRSNPDAAEAQGDDLLRARHARARRRGASAASDHRRGRVQRGLHDRRADPDAHRIGDEGEGWRASR